MRLRDNDLPETIEGEKRFVTLKLARAAGANTITNPAFSCNGISFGSPSVSGHNVTVMFNFDQAGDHTALFSADLANGEKLKGFIRAKVCSATVRN